jgi:Phospholipase_D-nuclease N-terminal
LQPGASETASAVILATVGVAFALMWIVALFDLLQRADSQFPTARPGSNPRLVWSVVVVLFGGIGAFVYYLSVMKRYPRRRR